MNLRAHRAPLSRLVLIALAALATSAVACSSTLPDEHIGTTSAATVVWKSTSASVELSSFGFWDGGSGYSKKRADLSPSQLAALDNLKVVDTPTGPIGADFTSYQLRITDADGTVTTYRAAQGNVVDSDEGSTDGKKTVDFDSLKPFLATIRCLSAGDTRDYTHSAADAGATATPWTPSVTMSDDTGCKNGVFVPYGCSTVRLKLKIETPSTYHVALASCFNTTRLRVLSEDGATELAASTEASEPSCASVDYAFANAGTYLVELAKSNGPSSAPACTINGNAGDVALTLSKP